MDTPNNRMSEILRQLSDKKKSRPWDRKLGNDGPRPAYTIEMDKEGRYEVVESHASARTHHSNFANKEEAEAWAAYRRDSADVPRKWIA
jgi:hypothetical protein